MGSFFGFNIARSGLFASQRALNVTAHNVANANTEGYSRQRLNVVQSTPLSLPQGQGMIGSGVDTAGIEQIRDEFLDFKIRQEMTTNGEWEARAEALKHIEAIFNEPSESGIRKVMDEFFASLHELSKNPDNLTARAEVRQRGIALTETLNHMYTQLQNLQANTDFAIETTVNQINGYAQQIASLNEQIYKYELDGNKANDLRDQRNLLIDKLSELVNIDVYEAPIPGSNNLSKISITINGDVLVSHTKYNQIKMERRTELNNYCDAPNLLNLKWENEEPLRVSSGKLKGLLDMRDNISGSEKGIPYYMDKLNRFTTVFAARFNMQHGKGYGLSGAGNHNQFFNGPVFDFAKFPENGFEELKDLNDVKGASDEDTINNFEEKNPNKTIFKIKDSLGNDHWYIADIIKADEISISKDIEDLNKIAAAKYDDGSGNGLAGDGSNAEALIELRHDVDMFTWGSPEDFFKSAISNLGVDANEAVRMSENQKVLIQQIDNKRKSISGVSLDEEMTNMVKFQHSYNANARMITAIDEMLDRIINGMGHVGR
ncbi:flagellar hook-associated protein 1 FlgK [Caminicella sporogenes DSM 14501]|uniref:Flagellar hook-associated protein 1 n=1 Tax=Caminicella sporogenes DSM 14501 TaxID=1121266 RepID=A0A1M6Q1Q8_9FIRM|nr:flagellar hook-associated protein FlgK [Caminicella sporogenes]SHK14031.1 flagellar hook-associated protein 1 FlgK [Caminicella sporogenes DSM 14501]